MNAGYLLMILAVIALGMIAYSVMAKSRPATIGWLCVSVVLFISSFVVYPIHKDALDTAELELKEKQIKLEVFRVTEINAAFGDAESAAKYLTTSQ